MHPLLGNRTHFAIYLGAWLGLGLLLAAGHALLKGVAFPASVAFAVPISILYGLVCLSAWWVSRGAPLESTPALRVLASAIGSALQGSAVWVATAAVWGGLLRRAGWLRMERTDLVVDAFSLFVIGVPLYLMSLALHYVLLALESSRESERRALAAQVAAREAEVRALRAQLNPHFLFNSLNSINALIGSAPEDARRMCEGLGDFLRRTLALGSRESVPLREEMALLDRYLAIEHVRFGERLRFERLSSPEAERCLVPPLLLQPLVENAIKHGIADRIEGGRVRVEARREDGALRVTVENDVDPDAPNRRGEGVGLENVRRRLATFAAREASLDVRGDARTFRVTLSLPARETPGEVTGG